MSDFTELIKELTPPLCAESEPWVAEQIAQNKSLAEAWHACEAPHWLVGVAWRMAGKPPGWPRNEEIVLAACAVVEAQLEPHGVEWSHDQHRLTLDTIRRWTRGEATSEDVKSTLLPTGFYGAGGGAGVLAVVVAVLRSDSRLTEGAVYSPGLPQSKRLADIVRQNLKPAFVPEPEI